MIALCESLPLSRKDLKTIKGIGKRKLEAYGAELLEIISRCSKKEIITTTIEDEAPKVTQTREKKGSTKIISLELFKEGKSLPEIAASRNLSISTIEGHISHFIGTGVVRIDQVLSADKISLLTEYFVSSNTRSVSIAKNHFGDRVSYGELQMVQAHMTFNMDGADNQENALIADRN
jgi:uncharacterized protein YpbB